MEWTIFPGGCDHVIVNDRCLVTDRRNYISGTQYSSIKLKEAELTVVVNNRIRGASTVE